MSFDFDKALNIASNIFDTTKKKVSEEAKIIGLSYDKGTAENDMEAAYADLGRIAYNKIKIGMDLGEEANELVNEVDNIKTEIENISKSISNHKIERDSVEYSFSTKDQDIEITIDEDDVKSEENK